MRQTVYIPDDLLERAQILLPDVNPSKLVQRGLAQLIQDFQGPMYANDRPEAVADDIARLRDHFTIEAKEEYERGYSMALAAANSLSWSLLEELAGGHNDLKRALRPYVSGAMQEALPGNSISPVLTAELIENRRNVDIDRSTPNAMSNGTPWSWLYRLAEDLGSIANPYGFDEYSFSPTRAFLRGYGDALYAVWVAVEEGYDPSRHDSDHHSMETQRNVERLNAGGL